MNAEQLHTILVEEFGEETVTGINTEATDPWVEIAPEAIREVARFLKDDDRLRFDHLTNLCGVDYLEPDPKKAKKFEHEPHIEVVYHLYSYDHKQSAVLKVKLPRWKNDADGKLPEVPSVAGVWAIADWHERETYDLLGVVFTGRDDLQRILLPEDWPGHPLRKDWVAPAEYHGIPIVAPEDL